MADYDVVVLNWAAFEDKELAEGFPPDLLPSTEAMTRLIFSPNAEVISIGNPSTLVGSLHQESRRLIDPRVRCDYWLPFSIGVEDDVGTQYRVDAEEWAAYFEHVSGWRWIATGEAFTRPYLTGSDYLRPVSNKATDVVSVFQPIATTRYLKLIALRVPIAAISYTRAVPTVFGSEPDPHSGEIVLEASPVFWLPAPDRVSVAEAVDTILRERYGIAQESRIPEWALAYSLPAEAPMAAEIAELEDSRRALEQRISDARGRAVEAARPRLLLYEKGKDALEPIVRETLQTLGSRVEDPEEDGAEDGKLFREEGSAVLEIKGRNGPIKQDDIRQVVPWASDAKLKDGVDYKPLIIGNPNCEKRPEERGDALAPNAATYASNGGVAVLTTAQLFEALRQKQAGLFDERRFWTTVFATSGLAELDEPTA